MNRLELMFIAKNKVRMHDTDMAGILYFPRQFRFIHDAWEDLMEVEGLDFDTLFNKENFVFVVVHAEADYHAPLRVGDNIEVHVNTAHVGQCSFSISYQIFKDDKTLVGSGKTVHVTLNNTTRKKIRVPKNMSAKLEKYMLD
ncbi:MAG: 1,4-dihydroxy-2-naphthoyl-CoA hydrolase [Chlamydiae bacterium]|nr:1,4-dihydroxy-2-naphthoyl-CoA hydrolase [Chlamydiota bacterium]